MRLRRGHLSGLDDAERIVNDWQARAACDGADQRIFFPEREDDTTWAIREAKRICSTCEVRVECLEYALTPPRERVGVWGGVYFGKKSDVRNALDRRRAARRRGAA